MFLFNLREQFQHLFFCQDETQSCTYKGTFKKYVRSIFPIFDPPPLPFSALICFRASPHSHCLIFHTAIIINRKNWRKTIKLHFENINIFLKKQTYTNAKTPSPCSLLFAFKYPPPPHTHTHTHAHFSMNVLFE